MDKKSILFVCLGNICRSPAAEAVFLHLIKIKKLEKSFEVDSAGTGSWHVGKKADSRMRDAASRRGIDINSIARQITVEDFKKFELIITMDTSNYQDVIHLSHGYKGESIAEIKPMLSFSTSSDLKDVPDPYYGGCEGFDNVLDMLEDACSELINQLSGERKD